MRLAEVTEEAGGRVSQPRSSERGFEVVVCFVQEVDGATLATCANRLKERSKLATPVERERNMFNFQTNVNLTALHFILLRLEEETATVLRPKTLVGKLSSVHSRPRVRHFIVSTNQKASGICQLGPHHSSIRSESRIKCPSICDLLL